MKRVVLVILFLCLVLAGVESYLRANLFKKVSYTNSKAIDLQLEERRQSSRWDIMVIGDSEVRWGVHPAVIESAFSRAGQPVGVFNHAFDGFGPSLWTMLYPRLSRSKDFANVRLVGIGVQLIDAHQFLRPDDAERTPPCGSLQRPVLSSSFGIDLSVDHICAGNESWDADIIRMLSHPLWLLRYRSSVKTLVLSGIGSRSADVLAFNSARVPGSYHGFEPHKPIAAQKDSFNDEFKRWKAQYDPARDFQPLPSDAWQAMVAAGGFFDRVAAMVRATGAEPFFFALPTNPLVIDTFGRRMDYRHNSAFLSKWAESRGVAYFDLGILDRVNGDRYFSDMRHLSAFGAEDYSAKLAALMIGSPIIQRSISRSRPLQFDQSVVLQSTNKIFQ
jgi:hypothetical protein